MKWVDTFLNLCIIVTIDPFLYISITHIVWLFRDLYNRIVLHYEVFWDQMKRVQCDGMSEQLIDIFILP